MNRSGKVLSGAEATCLGDVPIWCAMVKQSTAASRLRKVRQDKAEQRRGKAMACRGKELPRIVLAEPRPALYGRERRLRLMDGFERLACAIVELAAQDYRASRSGQPIDTKNAMTNIRGKYVADECRQFFLSGWFGVLSMSAMDGEELIALLDEDVRKGWKKPRERRKGSFL